jgi:PAS domain S-box-containing protein
MIGPWSDMLTTNVDDRLALLEYLVESISASPDLVEVLERVVESASSLAEDAVATLWISEDGKLIARVRGGARRSTWTGRSDFRLGEGLVGHAALARRPVLVADVLADPRTLNRDYFEAEALSGCAAIPLLFRDRLVGVLAVFNREARALGAPEVEMLTAFGAHAAVAIERARLYAEAERRRREAETLADITRKLAASPDLDTVLARIAEGAHALCAADLAWIGLRDAHDRFPMRQATGVRTDAYRRVCIVPGRGLGGRAVVTRRPGRVTDRLIGPPPPPEHVPALNAEGVRSALVVPIVIGDEVDGLLYVCRRTPRGFSEADEGVLLRLADHAAVAIHNGRLRAGERAARAEAERAARNFRELVDTLDAIVVEADADTFAITFVNGRAVDILGYPAEQWYAEPGFWAAHLHPDDREATVATCMTATAQGRDHVIEYRMLAADGRHVWLHDTVRVLPAGAAGRRRLLCVMVDVTDRKHSEALLAGEREILERIASGVPIEEILDGICRLIESLRDDMVASVLRLESDACLHHGAAPSLPEAYVRAIDGASIGPDAGSCGTAAYRNEMVIAADIATDPRWVAYRDLALSHGLRACWSAPVRDASGAVMATFAVYHRTPRAPRPDELELVSRAAQITRIALERDATTEALQRSEARYRTLVTNIPVVTWLADADGRTLFLSPTVEQVLGVSVEAFIGSGPDGRFGRVHPDDAAAVRAQYGALVRHGEVFDVEYRIQHGDGRWIWVHDRAVSTDERAGAVSVTGVFTDITDRRQAETIRALLLRRVVNVQEAERARLARELHDETAQLLAALLIGLHRIRRPRTLEDAARHAERLHAVAERALAEVRRTSRGLRPLALDDFGLDPALKRYAAEFGEMRGLAIAVRTIGLEERRLPSAVEIALYRIMQEALSNVARHAQATRATVTLEVDRAVAVMTVTDAGQGFDVGAALRASDDAVGLGLHTIRERAAILQGTATITSQPGHGTRVIVEIPLS